MHSTFTQYYTVICANLIVFIYGIAVGWPSASLPLLQSNQTPLPSGPITLLEASTIGSILCIGGAVGTVLYGWFAEAFGRKWAMMSTFFPSIISWVLIYFGTSPLELLISRFLSGFASGGGMLVIPLTVSEVADVEIRGRLGSLMMFFHNAGIVFGYAFCGYLDYYMVPYIPITLCFVFLVGYSFVPDTPKYLVLNGKYEAAKKSIRFFKRLNNDHDVELLLNTLDVGGEKTPLRCSELSDAATKRSFLIGLILMNSVCFSGAFTLSNYYETIFKEAGSSLTPTLSSIIVGTIQSVGVLSATLVIEKIGRKILTLTSAYLSALFLAILGTYAFLQEAGLDLNSFKWIPLASLSTLVFVASNGVTSVPYVIVGEIFKQNVRSFGVSICLISNWLTSFLLVLIFPYMLVYLKMYGSLWTFTVIGTTLATIILFIMPETKGIPIERIVQILSK